MDVVAKATIFAGTNITSYLLGLIFIAYYLYLQYSGTLKALKRKSFITVGTLIIIIPKEEVLYHCGNSGNNNTCFNRKV